MQPTEKKKRSPWLYVGIGCGVLLLLGIGGTVAAVMFGMSKFKEFTEDMADPVKRTEMAKKTLGADDLPEGYSAVVALSVPAIMDVALLMSGEPQEPSEQAEQAPVRTFVYFFIKASSLKDVEELRAFLEGRSDDASVLRRNHIDIQTREIIGRGVLQLDGRRVLYLSQRGVLRSSQNEDDGPGLNSLTFIECPGQNLLRMGLWHSPDPSPETPLDQLDVKGTPVDPEAIRAFMSHLNPCRGT
ncbi:hypothetical protein [Hyalangium versicolor]|uniref:hypothetical protein n=1 Tax=Hyalangium versicolor TaxID=2861190 RepID=UPI001CC94B41|nr:hypothetical protein [Hyalangium versicolor]